MEPLPGTFRIPASALMVRLRFLLLLGVALAGSSASSQEADSILAEGAAIDRNGPTLFRFLLDRDGRVSIEDLGRLEAPLDPRDGFPAMPDSALAKVAFSTDVLSLIHRKVSEAWVDPTTRNFSVSVESKRLRLQFDQGLPIWMVVGLSIGLLAIGGGLTALLLTRRAKQEKQHEEAARQRTFYAREAERSRLAREIHDGPLQDVHALRLLTGAQAAEVVESEAGRIARDLRAIAEGLRPPALGRFGLAAALAAHTRRIKERHPGLHFDLDLEENGAGPDTMPEIVRSALFRIAQEAITNAIEHGNASRIRLQLQYSDAAWATLTISDDGSGLPDLEPDLESLADGGHFGLIGMHERADALGGHLTLTSDGIDGRGVRVQVTTPTTASAKPKATRRRLIPA